MDIRVSGHQVNTGSALQDHAETKLAAMVEKYLNRAISSGVTFGKAPANGFSCDIVLHAGQGMILRSSGSAQDAHVAFDEAAEKIEKQLRRYKRRLKDHSERSTQAAREEEAAYTIFGGPADGDGRDLEAEDQEEVAESPPVIAETRVDVPEVSVSDAVMMLDLRDTTALFFKNAGTGRHNMVYRRGDGSIGWVEPG